MHTYYYIFSYVYGYEASLKSVFYMDIKSDHLSIAIRSQLYGSMVHKTRIIDTVHKTRIIYIYKDDGDQNQAIEMPGNLRSKW